MVEVKERPKTRGEHGGGVHAIRKVGVIGAGASAISCARLYLAVGARKENIMMFDSKGLLSKERKDLSEEKLFFVSDKKAKPEIWARGIRSPLKNTEIFNAKAQRRKDARRGEEGH